MVCSPDSYMDPSESSSPRTSPKPRQRQRLHQLVEGFLLPPPPGPTPKLRAVGSIASRSCQGMDHPSRLSLLVFLVLIRQARPTLLRANLPISICQPSLVMPFEAHCLHHIAQGLSERLYMGHPGIGQLAPIDLVPEKDEIEKSVG